MDDAQRWSVTYTKHVKQKRKVYQDGFLQLHPPRHKVMLYDESEKLLESRFVKKDDVINSGETLAFDSYLVDIGELCGGHKSTSNLNWQEKHRKFAEKSGSLYRDDSESNSISVDRTPTFWRRKEQVINISPSKTLIKDFKKTEMKKYGSSPSCRDMTNTSTTEWQVLYTTQITQKAKKFHDGYLQVVVCGSRGRQVMLYDATRRQLDTRFLKKDEIVCSGESIAIDGHLVEIGEQEGDHKPVTDSTLQVKNWKVVGRTDVANQDKIPTNKKFHAGKTPDKTSSGKLTNLNDASCKIENAKLSWRTAVIEPKRAVHDILSILRKPIHGKVVTMSNPLSEDCLELRTLDVHSDIKNCIKERAEECSRSTQKELREKTSDHDGGIKVLKPEAVEVLVAVENCAVSENRRESLVMPSTFCLRSGTTNCIAPVLNVEYTNHKMLVSGSSSVKPHTLVTSGLDSEGQTRIESATSTRLKDIQETEKSPEIFSCEEIITETKAATVSGLSSSKSTGVWEDNKGSSSGCSEAASSVNAAASNDYKFHDPSGTEEKTSKQDFHTKEMGEFPSFDLGF